MGGVAIKPLWIHRQVALGASAQPSRHFGCCLYALAVGGGGLPPPMPSRAISCGCVGVQFSAVPLAHVGDCAVGDGMQSGRRAAPTAHSDTHHGTLHTVHSSYRTGRTLPTVLHTPRVVLHSACRALRTRYTTSMEQCALGTVQSVHPHTVRRALALAHRPQQDVVRTLNAHTVACLSHSLPVSGTTTPPHPGVPKASPPQREGGGGGGEGVSRAVAKAVTGRWTTEFWRILD